MTVRILDYTRNPLNRIGEVAGICYSSDTTNKEKNISRAKECIVSGHGTTTEFVDVTLVLEGDSIRVMREIMRSRIASYLQQSTRYVNLEEFNYFTPPSIENNKEAKQIYDDTMEYIRQSYKKLLDLNIPQEDVANLLALGVETKVVLKMNLRILQQLMGNRLCTRAYIEARQLMINIKTELYKLDDEWKYICDNLLQPKCIISGRCTEKNCCGLIDRINNKGEINEIK